MFIVIIVCYVFVPLNFLKRRLHFVINVFAAFISKEGSDCLILTFLLGLCLSASSEIRLVVCDAYMSISLIFSDSQSVSRMSRDRDWKSPRSNNIICL